ncbi:MAG: hypothetical protein K9J24_14980 [Bacteroidales bacterium]|nr:hypothetical protein [Bacteroidales bacterium]
MKWTSILSLILIFSACKKSDNPSDYRDQYTGEYYCHVEIRRTTMTGVEITEEYKTVHVTKATADNEVVILGYEVPIDKKGEFDHSKKINGFRFFSLSFNPEDSLYISNNIGGLAEYTTKYYKGKKKYLLK